MPQRAELKRAIAFAALAVAGCSGGAGGLGNLGPGPLPYQYSNAIAPSGYSESIIAPDRYRIQVQGPANTPRERMEKIATTRAAEIGKENRLGYFKIDSVQLNVNCQQYIVGGKPTSQGSGERKKSAYAVMTADVSYTKQPPDASYLDSRQFEQYKAELDADKTAPPPLDPAAVQQCS